MDFEYDYETWDDMTQEELEALADDLATGRDPELYNEIMNNISIVPRLISIEDTDESE
jgi:hypothetical protein